MQDDTSPATLQLQGRPALGEIPEASWDALLRPDDNPFLRWGFLEALERAGSVAPARGWWPCHLTVWEGGELAAAAPAYVKGDGMGDFSRDWSFSHALGQLGGELYPKLVVGVPFSPISGRRFLVRPGLDRRTMSLALLHLARELARANQLAAVQVLYHRSDECEVLEEAGFLPRALVQYHWHNRGFAQLEDWLAILPSKKRTQIRRERRELVRQGVSLRTVRGEELAATPERWAETAYALYRTTCEKYMWGGTYLNRASFDLLFERLEENVELVVAERGAELVAGAINLASPTHLFGRYWGCFEELRFLHFNVCIYHSVEECIRRGTKVFEGGAGGEHKLARGFEPTVVHTAHWFDEPRVMSALGPALRADLRERQAEVASWHEERGLDPIEVE